MIGMLNGAGTVWGEFFLLAVLQNTIFLGIVFAALYLLRRAPARVKYIVALAGLIKLVLPPFLRLPALITMPEKASGSYGSLIPFVTGSAGSSAAATPEAGAQGLTVSGALLGIWMAIVITGLLFTAAASARLALKLRGACAADRDDIPDLPGVRGIRILRSGNIVMPMTVAFFPGRIYVPAAWDEWSMSCRRMVLMHEMAHMKRRDGIFLIMQIIAKAIYFFHPFVFVLDRRLSEYREMACDDATVGSDRDSSVEYSRYLVEIAESIVRCPAVCVSASALIRRKNELLARVSYQLEEGRMRSISRTRVIVLMAAIVLLAVSLSWYRGEASAGGDYPDPPPPPKPSSVPAVPGEGGKRTVNVALESDGAEVDGKSIDMSQLVEALAVVGGEDPENVMVSFVCADDVPMSDLRIFHEALEAAGIDKIRYGQSGGEGLALQLPPQKALDTLKELPAEMIIDVSVGAGGPVMVGSKKVTSANLSDVIADELSRQPHGIVVIRNEDETTYGDFTRVLRLVKEAGAERVVVKFEKE
jgi:beta-lactamase regulating signal transducer with metallopeptidase domain/biopolymer transport protein ExbD